MAVDVQSGQHLEGVVLPRHALGPRLKSLGVVVGPPVLQVALPSRIAGPGRRNRASVRVRSSRRSRRSWWRRRPSRRRRAAAGCPRENTFRSASARNRRCSSGASCPTRRGPRACRAWPVRAGIRRRWRPARSARKAAARCRACCSRATCRDSPSCSAWCRASCRPGPWWPGSSRWRRGSAPAWPP